jgi:hypothetical protein
MVRVLQHVLAFLGLWSEPSIRVPSFGHLSNPNASRRLPPEASSDPYAWQPVPLKPMPKARGGAVAVAEPDE